MTKPVDLYQQLLAQVAPEVTARRECEVCLEGGVHVFAQAKGLCMRHYLRRRNHGDARYVPASRSAWK